MSARRTGPARTRLALACGLIVAGWSQADMASAAMSQDERDAAIARYQAIQQQLEDVEQQAEALDRAIERAENDDDDGATPAATAANREPQAPAPAAQQQAQAPQQAPAQPVVAAARREEAEAVQAQEMPDLPRINNDIGGVLTPRGQLVVEPSWNYTYSSVNRVAIEGFTILPALLIGVIDVVEADRETNVASFSARYGITNRLEAELKGSYISRSDTTRSREFLTDAVEDSSFNASSSGRGDYEFGLRYQFPKRNATGPYLVGNLRYKHDNGTDPFAISRQSQLTGDPQFSSQLPTGSGFKSLHPSLTFIYPSDPVVFFGGVGYLWTEKDDKGTWLDDEGNEVGFGEVDPGDALRLNLGLGLGLNDRASMSISYQLDKFSKTWIETASVQNIAGSDITVGKVLFGYSLRMNSGNSLSLAFGIGATQDAPDTDLSFRMPFSFTNN